MTAPTIEGIDIYEWLEAIANHPDLNEEHSCAAFDLLGVKTSLSEERLRWLHYELETYGFLRANQVLEDADGFAVRYQFLLPTDAVPDSELEQ